MRRFADELKAEGFAVDYRRASSMRAGVIAHQAEFKPERVSAMSPMSYDGLALLRALDVEVVDNDQFLCSAQEFAAWAGDRSNLKMEDFYRWQRQRLNILMDGKKPVGGTWNYDAENREPPPKDGRSWPAPIIDSLDATDARVIADIARRAPRRSVRHSMDCGQPLAAALWLGSISLLMRSSRCLGRMKTQSCQRSGNSLIRR